MSFDPDVIAASRLSKSWECLARKALGANDPQDCSYPYCACEPERSEDKDLAVANSIAVRAGLSAAFLSDDPSLRVVGVQGDQRTYERPISLSGPFPGWEVLALVSKEISECTRFNKVVLDMTGGSLRDF